MRLVEQMAQGMPAWRGEQQALLHSHGFKELAAMVLRAPLVIRAPLMMHLTVPCLISKSHHRFVCVPVCLRVYARMHTHTHAHTHIQAHSHTHMQAHTHTNKHTHTHAHTKTKAKTKTNTHRKGRTGTRGLMKSRQRHTIELGRRLLS